jgi:hypothetical protein
LACGQSLRGVAQSHSVFVGFAFFDFLALAGEAEVEQWEERERTTAVEVQETDLQTIELFGVVDQTADLNPDDAIGPILDPRELYANDFSCDVRDTAQLDSRDAFFYQVRQTYAEPIELSCEVHDTSQLSSPDAGFYVVPSTDVEPIDASREVYAPKLNSLGELIYLVHETGVEPNEFFCEIHETGLKSSDIFFYMVHETDVEPVYARVIPVENVDPQSANVSAFRKNLRGVPKRALKRSPSRRTSGAEQRDGQGQDPASRSQDAGPGHDFTLSHDNLERESTKAPIGLTGCSSQRTRFFGGRLRRGRDEPSRVRYDTRKGGRYMGAKRVTRWVAEEIRSRRARGETILTLDVRTPDARVVHPYEIPGSSWLPLAEVVQHSTALPRDAAIVAYCT